MYSNNFKDYHEYLKKKSFIGNIYRNYWLFPKLKSVLVGNCIDIGCGTGEFARFRPNTVGADINPLNLDLLKSVGVPTAIIENNRIDFDDATFDSILMDNVLEHIADPTEILNEAIRLLKVDGQFLIGVPGLKGFKDEVDHKVFYELENLRAIGQRFSLKYEMHFYTPFELSWFNENLKQYCLYVLFKK